MEQAGDTGGTKARLPFAVESRTDPTEANSRTESLTRLPERDLTHGETIFNYS